MWSFGVGGAPAVTGGLAIIPLPPKHVVGSCCWGGAEEIPGWYAAKGGEGCARVCTDCSNGGARGVAAAAGTQIAAAFAPRPTNGPPCARPGAPMLVVPGARGVGVAGAGGAFALAQPLPTVSAGAPPRCCAEPPPGARRTGGAPAGDHPNCAVGRCARCTRCSRCTRCGCGSEVYGCRGLPPCDAAASPRARCCCGSSSTLRAHTSTSQQLDVGNRKGEAYRKVQRQLTPRSSPPQTQQLQLRWP